MQRRAATHTAATCYRNLPPCRATKGRGKPLRKGFSGGNFVRFFPKIRKMLPNFRPKIRRFCAAKPQFSYICLKQRILQSENIFLKIEFCIHICYIFVTNKTKQKRNKNNRDMKTKVTKKEIIATLRSLDVTRICALYKRVNGESPSKVCNCGQIEYKRRDGFKIYKWAAQYATSAKMDRNLYRTLDRTTRYDEEYAHSEHGIYEPLRKSFIINYLKKECQDPNSNYAKRPMMGNTHLYFCSPVYGHRDYNKWCALPIEGNEAFCEKVIAFADKFFAPIYD